MENKNNKIFIIVITAIITVMLTTAANNFIDRICTSEAVEKVSVVKRMLSEYSLFDVDEEKMADYAAMAMAVSVDDPYTAYFSKDEFSSFIDNVTSSYVGMGAMLGADTKKNEITVISTVEGAPADKAGIRAGDKVVSVDGEKYDATRLTEVSMYIKGGAEGTKVLLTVEREGEGTLNFEITREKIVKHNVKSRMLTDDIGYIKITGFDGKKSKDEKDTYDEFKENMNALKASDAEKLIIDLRDNPGGDLSVVSKIADEFLPEGIITYTEDKNGKRDTIYSDKEEIDMPIVILTNGGSASASEIMTSALKDHKKATVIGTKTYGKGIVQSVFPFSDGSGMSITTAKYFTPNGECIHKIGIEPDIVVELSGEKPLSKRSDKEDNQLGAAIEFLSR